MRYVHVTAKGQGEPGCHFLGRRANEKGQVRLLESLALAAVEENPGEYEIVEHEDEPAYQTYRPNQQAPQEVEVDASE